MIRRERLFASVVGSFVLIGIRINSLWKVRNS